MMCNVLCVMLWAAVADCGRGASFEKRGQQAGEHLIGVLGILFNGRFGCFVTLVVQVAALLPLRARCCVMLTGTPISIGMVC